MTGPKHAGAIALLVVLATAALWPGVVLPRVLAAQDEPAEVIEVGSGPIGERTMSLVGRGNDDGAALTIHGYLTSIVGLGPEALFGDAQRSVETARFTVVADIAVGETDNRADVAMTAGAGELRIYVDERAGANWDEPASFADGQLIASYSLDLDETRQNQAPGVGVVAGDGLMTQRTAEEFSFGGQRYRFGVTGIEQRLRYVGAQVAATPTSQAMVTLTGWTTVTRRESVVVVLGSPGAATPAASAEGCAAVEAWLNQTVTTLSDVGSLGAGVSPDADVAALDGEALRVDAARAAELIAAQRGLVVPEQAADAHRLAVTATSTSARGLQLLVDAADEGDADLLALGRAAIQDGEELAGRAADAAQEAAASCGEGG